MNYNQFAWYYDSLMEPKFYEDYFNFIKENTKYHTILDLGCGTGRVDGWLVNDSCSVHGVDLSNQMIEIAKQNIQHPNAYFEVADMTLFETNKKFELVFNFNEKIEEKSFFSSSEINGKSIEKEYDVKNKTIINLAQETL